MHIQRMIILICIDVNNQTNLRNCDYFLIQQLKYISSVILLVSTIYVLVEKYLFELALFLGWGVGHYTIFMFAAINIVGTQKMIKTEIVLLSTKIYLMTGINTVA